MNINYNFIKVAFLFIIFDILTGVLGACVRGDFESKKMREGGKHKLFLVVVLAFGVSLDYAQMLIDLGINLPACECICSYVGIMEVLSVIENINMTFPGSLPRTLTNILYQKAEDVGIDKKE